MHKCATFSPCRRYRYTLWRRWYGLFGGGRYVNIVGLNPSTADELEDDMTIKRCIAFSRSWGFDALCMTNLFAWRATKPIDMLAQLDPIGEENNRCLQESATNAEVIIAAWGTHGVHCGRDQDVRAILPPLHYLRLTKDGHPSHPLYLPGDLRPVLWEEPSVGI